MELYVGSDESGNGAEFEVHTAVFSKYPQDVFEKEWIGFPFEKIREHKNLHNKLKKRAHSFITFSRDKKEKIKRADRSGVILASLLHDEFEWDEIDRVNIYLDGFKKQSEIDRISDILYERVPRFDKTRMNVAWGANYDCRIFVVNLADELAHYLFRKGEEYLIKHKDRKALLC